MCYRMKELLDDVEPFISDHEIIDDLHRIIATLESMEIFKNLGLLDMKCIEFKFKVLRQITRFFSC